MARNHRSTKRWHVSEALLRSAFQKYCRRGLVDKALLVASELVINGVGRSVATRLILFVLEDYAAASPQLVVQLIPRVQTWLAEVKRRKIKLADLPCHIDLCHTLFQLVSWVAQPQWRRSRALAFVANRSLKALEDGENLMENTLLADMAVADRLWVSHAGSMLRLLQTGFLQAKATEATAPLVNELCQALRLLAGHSRLAVLFALAHIRGYWAVTADVLPLQPVDDTARLLSNDVACPHFEDYVKDMHTAQGRHTDMAFFLNIAAHVVNESVPTDPDLLRWAQEGKSHYYDMERRYGTKQARSRKIRDRLQDRLQPQPPPAKRQKNDSQDFQDVMRARMEPAMPPFLRNRVWLQKVCSGSKCAVIAIPEQGLCYKGPYIVEKPSVAARVQRISDRYDALTACGVSTPRARWLQHDAVRFRVSEYIEDAVNFFDKEKTASAIPDDAAVIASLVCTGVAKQCLTSPPLGDLACRNTFYSPSRQQYFAVDLEDNATAPTDFSQCSLFELVFGSDRRACKEKRDRLTSLIVKHARAVLSALQQLRPDAHAMFSRERWQQACSRIQACATL